MLIELWIALRSHNMTKYKIMKAHEILPKTKSLLWTASVRIQHPNYVGRIDVTVTAPTANLARQLMKAQYNVPDWHIGSIKQVK